jgi:HSP20 family protein
MAVVYSPFRPVARAAASQPQFRQGPRLAAVDLYRADDVFTLTVDLPGVDANSIDVDVDGNQLTIRAERTAPSVEGATWLSRERSSGAIVRKLSLGDGIDRENIAADYANGVLTVTIPVSEKAKPRKVSVAGAPVAEVAAE